MFIHEPSAIALTLLFLGAVATGAGHPAMNDDPKGSSVRATIAGRARGRMTRTRSRHRAGCSWSAACSTRRANRCRARRSWSMRGA